MGKNTYDKLCGVSVLIFLNCTQIARQMPSAENSGSFDVNFSFCGKVAFAFKINKLKTIIKKH